MNFVSPLLFWAGGAAIAAPILIHLLNRQRYRRIRWAAMEFLLLAFKRTRRRIQIEHLIMLLIRCLMLLMLAMALARPIFSGLVVSGSRDVYVLLDDSYSMNYKSTGDQTAFDRARVRLRNVLDSLSAGDRLHVIKTSDVIKNQTLAASGESKEISEGGIQSTKLTSLEIERFGREISALAASDLHTDIYAGLNRIYNLMFNPPDPRQRVKELYVISDFQKYPWIPGAPAPAPAPEGTTTVEAGDVKGEDISAILRRHKTSANVDEFTKLVDSLTTKREDGIEVQMFLVDVGDPAMLHHKDIIVQNVWADPKELVCGLTPSFKATVWNNSDEDARDVKVTFWVDGREEDTKTIPTIMAHKSGDIRFQRPFTDEEAGPHCVEVVVDVKDNPTNMLQNDSHCFFAFKVRRGIKVLIVDGDYNEDLVKSETGTLQYLIYPTPSSGGYEFGGGEFERIHTARPVVVDKMLKEEDKYNYPDFDIVIVANLNVSAGEPSDSQIDLLERYVKAGGRLVFFLGNNVDAVEYNSRLYRGGDGIMPVRLFGKPEGKDFSESRDLTGKATINPKDISHEIFAPLNNYGMLGPKKTRPYFSRYFAMEVPDGTEGVAYFDQHNSAYGEDLSKNVPFMLEKRFANRGRVMLFNTTADSAWNNLPESGGPDEVFLILVHETIFYLLRTEQSNVEVCEPVSKIYTLAPGQSKDLFFMTAPDSRGTPAALGERGVVETVAPGGRSAFYNCIWRKTFVAGPYRMQFGNETQYVELFAANVNLGEADLERLSPNELKEKYPELGPARIMTWDFGREDGGPVEIATATTSSDAWKLPLFIMLGLLALESALALWFGHRAAR